VVTSAAIKAQAREIGFELCGVAPAEAFPELAFFQEWINCGYAGTMAYLPRSAKRRSDVRRVVPTARTVIMTGSVYHAGQPYSIERHEPGRGEVARYTWGGDYHEVIGKRLESLLTWMRVEHPDPFDARWYVDRGPVQERVYAQYAGLGWIGKNTCLINQEAGSWILLGAIICGLSLEHDVPALDQCGTCTLCLEACPTAAFVEPHVLDATRCLSYLTIEHRGSIPEEHREPLGNHLFGCDICQEVCPWNDAPIATSDPSWSSREDLNLAHLIDLWRRRDAELEEFVGGSAMTRAGVKGLRRNLAVALGNSGDARALDALGESGDETTHDPLVAEHVEWAKRRLERVTGS